MTPKEKAEELHLKMCKAIATELTFEGFYTNTIHAKNCALIVVDEIIEHSTYVSTGIKPSIYNYWQEVKHEIENL